jgi:hypothetical protein
MLRQNVERTEYALGRARELSQGIAAQTGKAVERTREVGGSMTDGTQELFEQLQKRVGRG